MVRREGNRDPARESKRERGREGEGGRERERERDLWTCKARILNPEANLHVKES